MKWFLMPVLVFLYSLDLMATSYAPMSLKERIKRSAVIAMGEIVSLKCVDPKGQLVPIGRRCSGPGNPNMKVYEFQISKVLKDSTDFFKKKRLPLQVGFKFTSMAHTNVPKDNYASATGKKRIVFLRWFGSELKPVHEAFYFVNTDQKSKIDKILKSE